MRLEDMMTAGVVTIEPGESIGDARTEMRRHGVRHLVVIHGGRVAGIVSERDLGRVARAGDLTVQDVMSTDVVTATPATTLRQAANSMRGHTSGCLVVMEDGDVLGLVTPTDLLDQLERAAPRPTVRTEAPPLGHPSGSGRVRGRTKARQPTTPRHHGRRTTPVAERESFPPALPRPVKLTRDRTSALPPPAHIRVIGAQLDDENREYMARKLATKLGKFRSSIERVTVRLSDANGPKGGRDQVCRIKVVLSGLPSIVVDERDSRFQRAVDRAIDSTAVAVRRSLQRRRMKPLRGRSRTGAGTAV
jgi:hypothetical protein